MKKKSFFLFGIVGFFFLNKSFSQGAHMAALQASDHKTPFELSGRKRTATYEECVAWYRNLNKAFPDITYFDSIGFGDAGKQIYVFRIYNSSLDPRLRVLVNNNIHPGEPEGTDASMLLARTILTNQVKWKNVLSVIDLHIICQYNVDGTLRQSCCTRANQNGPENMGFRANAKNLDLNRDFIKMDSRNAKAFVKYFTAHNFHALIDNHTSDGADYQYTLTWFHTRPEKLGGNLGTWLNTFDAQLRTKLEKNGWPNCPYVETVKEVPDSGITAFWETGRFATGFAALHHCIGYTVETHMLKPFDQRVFATYDFMFMFLQQISNTTNAQPLIDEVKKLNGEAPLRQGRKEYIRFELYAKKADTINFLGYEFSHKKSEVTGQDRLFYDRSKPWKKRIPYYRYFKPVDSAQIPRVYFIPYAWQEVVDRLLANGITVQRNVVDTLIALRVSYIRSYETIKNPYEGHYLHYNTKTSDTLQKVVLRKGDYIVPVTVENYQFLAAVLEPRSPDSYFNWNFFDAVLQQKEWFSDYVWEDKAAEILKTDTALKQRFEQKKSTDENFAKDANAQLLFIYRNSAYYENSHNLYPVWRMD